MGSRKAFLMLLADVYEGEAARRTHQPDFAATLRAWAAKARAEAAAHVEPQMELFGDVK